MLLTSSALPFIKEKLLKDTENILLGLVAAEESLQESSDSLVDAMEALSLIKKVSSSTPVEIDGFFLVEGLTPDGLDGGDEDG